MGKTQKFIAAVKNLFPNLIVLGEYIDNKTHILIQDDLGISYNIVPRNLLRGVKPSIKTALNKTEAFKVIMSQILPTITILGDYNGCFETILVKDEYNIEYLSRPMELLKGMLPSVISAVNKTDWFIQKAQQVHGTKYNYLDNYRNYNNKLNIICPIHGNFLQTPHVHLNGSGCLKCGYENNSGTYASVQKYKPDSEVFIYLIKCYNKTEVFYKIGLSIQLKGRFSSIPYKIKVLATVKGTVSELYRVEQYYKNKFKSLKINYVPKIKFGGYTECFN